MYFKNALINRKEKQKDCLMNVFTFDKDTTKPIF